MKTWRQLWRGSTSPSGWRGPADPQRSAPDGDGPPAATDDGGGGGGGGGGGRRLDAPGGHRRRRRRGGFGAGSRHSAAADRRPDRGPQLGIAGRLPPLRRRLPAGPSRSLPSRVSRRCRLLTSSKSSISFRFLKACADISVTISNSFLLMDFSKAGAVSHWLTRNNDIIG